MKKRKRSPLGHAKDQPRQILRVAECEVTDAVTPLAVRQAAEKAYLALASSLEVLAGETFESAGAQTKAAGRLEKHNRGMSAEFQRLKTELHGQCFHRADCTRATVLKAIGKVEAFLDRLPRKLP